jgi:FdhE protein
MSRTTTRLRAGTASRLAQLERQRPEWSGWLRLVREIQRALEDDGWASVLAAEVEPAAEVPLLQGRTLETDAARARRLLRRLATAAADSSTSTEERGASLRDYRPTTPATVELLAAALRQDRAAIEAVARRHGVDAKALGSVAELAVFPLLHSCGRLLASQVAGSWNKGYCPLCASWPVLSERRGIDRTRRLRCGRCGSDWEIEWLCCVYCDERHHDRLGSLVDEERGPEDGPKVETCATCRGYLKSVATLQAIPPFELLLQDLDTVELDLVALERGYRRPAEPGFALDANVTARAAAPIWRRVRGG